MSSKKNSPKKPYFSQRGNGEDFDYLRSNTRYTFAAGFLLLIMVGLVETGFIDWLSGLLR